MWIINSSLWYLMDIALSFYVMILMLRLLLQLMHANYYNPLCQFVIRLTTPIIKPMQNWFHTWHGIDTAVLTLIVVLTALKFLCLGWLIFDQTPKLLGVVVWVLGDILISVIHLYIYLIIGRVILSLLHNPQLAPVLEVLYQLTEPALRPAKRFLPIIAGFDISPLVVALVLQLILTIVAGPVEIYGQQLAFHAKLH